MNKPKTKRKLKIEKGKLYVLRSGAVVEVVTTTRNDPKFPIISVCVKSGAVKEHTIDGRNHEYGDNWLDIVSEHFELPEFDRRLLPAWINRAIAMDSDGSWYAFNDIPDLNKVVGLWDRLGDDFLRIHIPKEMNPKFDGPWTQSLLVWDDDGRPVMEFSGVNANNKK